MTVKVTLDPDERDTINCLIEKSIQKDKILKYLRGHGINLLRLGNKPFEYDKSTGTVTWDEA